MNPLRLLPVLLLAGCTTPRDATPDATARADADAEQTIACLVRELDATDVGIGVLGPGPTHHAVMIVPGQVYEVIPSRATDWFDGVYSVRVTAEDAAAAMELRAARNQVLSLTPAMEACGGNVAVNPRNLG